MRCAKTDKPIEMPFGVWTCAGPINHVLSRGLDTHRNMEFFFGGGAPLRCVLSSKFFDHLLDSSTQSDFSAPLCSKINACTERLSILND